MNSSDPTAPGMALVKREEEAEQQSEDFINAFCLQNRGGGAQPRAGD
jgi:hypothetical protein